ncbi:hypothetical protein F8M41_000929 [Gigaspora margarita]|uniref:Uncharacterized protein n=1 Tax=Gigaspora margarita TaxID=4874 RepID=A0A8H4A9M0_GIGMA|nr:hypothetical protein F8M41_000929 [Gigaspora margarita]
MWQKKIKPYLHEFKVLNYKKEDIVYPFTQPSNTETALPSNERKEASKFHFPPNKQFTPDNISGSGKPQNKHRRGLQKEMKPYLQKFRVEAEQEDIMHSSQFTEFVNCEYMTHPVNACAVPADQVYDQIIHLGSLNTSSISPHYVQSYEGCQKNNQIEVVNYDNMLTIMEEYFDFEAFEKFQENFQ